MGNKDNCFDNSHHIDDVGRIVIPKSMRKHLGITSKKTPLEMYVDSDKLVIKVFTPGCIICGETENTFELKGKKVCKNCIEKLNKIKEISE